MIPSVSGYFSDDPSCWRFVAHIKLVLQVIGVAATIYLIFHGVVI